MMSKYVDVSFLYRGGIPGMPAHRKIREIMHRDMGFVQPRDALSSTLKQFLSGNRRYLPVIENGVLLGLLSQRQILNHLNHGGNLQAEVREVMEKEPPTAPGSSRAGFYLKSEWEVLVVLDDQGRPEGILERENLLRFWYDNLGKLFFNTGSEGTVDERLPESGIVTNSPELKQLLDLALKVAVVDSTVLILGESGVGKELVAKFVHNNSKRKAGPFIKINCGAIPETLLESELFGYMPGAFTGASKDGKIGLFELAHKGTLFLDEIGDLPLNLQVKLLRVLQDREIVPIGGQQPRTVDVRILAATHRDIAAMTKSGQFREDLYFRLHVVPLHIPPLRERKEDIVPIIFCLREKFHLQYDLRKEISPEAMQILLDYPWPGNVRELENVMERLMVTAPGPVIKEEHIPAALKVSTGQSAATVTIQGILPLKAAVLELERQLIDQALQQYGSTYKAAQALKVDQSTIVRKLNKLKKSTR